MLIDGKKWCWCMVWFYGCFGDFRMQIVKIKLCLGVYDFVIVVVGDFFGFDGFEQCFEVVFVKFVIVFMLDEFKEYWVNYCF